MFIVIASPNPALAKEYSFESVDIDVQINADGSFDLTDKRTYDFRDEFSWATYKVYKEGAQDITEFMIFEGNNPFQRSSSGEPGTVEISDNEDAISAKWFFSARDEKRTFTIKYKAVDSVKAYSDAAVFYWKLIGNEWDVPTGRVTANVHLPQEVDRQDIRAWAHGPLQGKVTIVDGKTVNFDVSELAPETFVEGRITFPPDVLNVTPSPEKILPSILKEEKGWADEANKKRAASRLWNILGLVIGPLSLLIGLIAWFRVGKEYRLDYDVDYLRELPDEYPPAVAGYLWKFGKVDMQDFVATIMDMGRRGIIKIAETTETQSGLFGSKTRYEYTIERMPRDGRISLLSIDGMIYDLLFNTIGKGDSVTMGQIKKYAQTNPQKFKNKIDEWEKTVSNEAEKHGFIEARGTYAMYANIAAGSVVAVIGFALLVNEFYTGVVALILGIFQTLVSSLFKRRSHKGALQYRQWSAFRRFLLHFSNMKEALPSSMTIWEHYLVYAAALGVAKEVIEQLKVVLPSMGQDAYAGPAWFQSSRGVSGLAAMDSLNSSFSNMTSVANSAMSSSSGGGGGFSSGGGGGGGGGGGSAG